MTKRSKLAYALLVLLPCAAAGQQSPLVSYSSANGFFQATAGVRIDATLFVPHTTPPWLIRETDAFIAPRASLFGEAFVGNAGYGFVELRADRGEVPSTNNIQFRVEQLFARLTASPALELQAGKFISPFGSYPQRHGTTSDPLIRPPLTYDWPTLISPGFVPAENNGIFTWKDSPETFRPRGVPAIWSVPYQVGVMAFGTRGPLSYRVAAMNSAPSSIPSAWDVVDDLWKRPSFVVSFGYQITAALRTGVSVDRGPFMRDQLEGGAFPTGTDAKDYAQTIIGVDAAYARDHTELRGECFLDRWDFPVVIGTPTDFSCYVESKVKLAAGAFIGARVAHMRFNSIPLTPAAGSSDSTQSEEWDFPVSRVQLGGGYQISRMLSVRGEYQMTIRPRQHELKDNLLSVQVRLER